MWTCDRCGTSNSDDRYQCSKCKNFNATAPEAHIRWLDWTCSKCGTDNGGAFEKCRKCEAKR